MKMNTHVIYMAFKESLAILLTQKGYTKQIMGLCFGSWGPSMQDMQTI